MRKSLLLIVAVAMAVAAPLLSASPASAGVGVGDPEQCDMPACFEVEGLRVCFARQGDAVVCWGVGGD